MENKFEINGDLTTELLNGATIVRHMFTGMDWHVLTKSAKGDQWSYKIFETMGNINESKLNLMTTLKMTPKEAIKKFNDNYYEAKIHFDKFVKPLKK